MVPLPGLEQEVVDNHDVDVAVEAGVSAQLQPQRPTKLYGYDIQWIVIF